MEREFYEGFIKYQVKFEIEDEIELRDWDDGYIAFSNGEKRLKELLSMFSISTISELLQLKFNPVDGIEGYVVEVDLWRSRNNVYEEISIEREDRGFLLQHWILSQKELENSKPCYLREVETLPRKNSLFKRLSSIEVIIPEFRLHFFITKEGG